QCAAPATFVSGDTNGNSLLDPGEAWTFTCSTTINTPTTNTATITGQPSDATGAPLPGFPTVSANATAFVDVLQPGISIDKTPPRGPVVAAPGPRPVPAPAAPRRPAQSLYDVTTPGAVPPQIPPNPPVDDTCGPLVFVGGDSDNDALLDVDETWTYSCQTLLS